MSYLRACVNALALAVLTAAVIPAHAQQKMPDSTLYSQYSALHSTEIDFTVCGSLPQSSGCYGGGSLGPFTNACAIVQSVPAATNLNTVVRYIYVLDTGSGSGGFSLAVFKRTDTVSQTEDRIVVTRLATVPLPTLVAGTSVSCMMAQNATAVYASTTQSSTAAIINRTTYAVTTIGGGSSTINGITADSYGYVMIDEASQGVHGIVVYGPSGGVEETGGGDFFMINPINSVAPSNYPWP